MTPSELTQLRALSVQQVEPIAQLAQCICEVPSPTGQEQQRAEFIASLWQERGYTPEIDSIGNVYIRRGKQMDKPVLMLLAHTDTVFPASTPIVVRRDGNILRGPGIGDNSLSVAAMLTAISLFDTLGLETPVDLVAVANVGEEGLGNLRGARAAVERYRKQLGAVIVVDGDFGSITHIGVGSKRWRITVRGPGGHSYGDFGVPSAIHALGKIIASIANLNVPSQPKTTFNIGMIEGGTSINTIAAEASALLDTRSTDRVSLDKLADQVRLIVGHHAIHGLQTEIEVLGERPAGERSKTDPLVQLAAEVLTWLGQTPTFEASSTDANIPMSLNIPTVCIGITHGDRAHTIDEYISLPPIGNGLAQLLRLCIEASNRIAQGRL